MKLIGTDRNGIENISFHPEEVDPMLVNPVGVGRSCGLSNPQVKTYGYSRFSPSGNRAAARPPSPQGRTVNSRRF
jgi:hypothetical protein